MRKWWVREWGGRKKGKREKGKKVPRNLGKYVFVLSSQDASRTHTSWSARLSRIACVRYLKLQSASPEPRCECLSSIRLRQSKMSIESGNEEQVMSGEKKKEVMSTLGIGGWVFSLFLSKKKMLSFSFSWVGRGSLFLSS